MASSASEAAGSHQVDVGTWQSLQVQLRTCARARVRAHQINVGLQDGETSVVDDPGAIAPQLLHGVHVQREHLTRKVGSSVCASICGRMGECM